MGHAKGSLGFMYIELFDWGIIGVKINWGLVIYVIIKEGLSILSFPINVTRLTFISDLTGSWIAEIQHSFIKNIKLRKSQGTLVFFRSWVKMAKGKWWN